MTRILSTPRPMREAVRLYEYLCHLDGKCLTGQMESHWCMTTEHEIHYLTTMTGRMPAIRGLDFIDNDFLGVVQRSIDWWARGGIVTICWHTGPDFSSGYPASKDNDIDWETCFTPGTKAHDALIAGMDRAVPYLRRLERAGVPVLWRPFHELDGGWFWWGRGGTDNFIRLWRMMHDRYTNLHGLTNLIWVLGFSGEPGDYAPWYPGDDVVDVLGADTYTPGAAGDLYARCKALAPEGMPLAFHECGTIPTRAQLEEANAPWAWFMTWHTQWLTSPEFNSRENLLAVYRDPSFVTLDRLPGFMGE